MADGGSLVAGGGGIQTSDWSTVVAGQPLWGLSLSAVQVTEDMRGGGDMRIKMVS